MWSLVVVVPLFQEPPTRRWVVVSVVDDVPVVPVVFVVVGLVVVVVVVAVVFSGR